MIGLPCGEKNNCDNRPNVQPFSSNRLPEHHGRTDGRTDRIAISISRVSVLMRAKNSTLTVICPRGRARGSRFFFGRLSLYLISLARWRLLFATLVHDVNTFHSCSWGLRLKIVITFGSEKKLQWFRYSHWSKYFQNMFTCLNRIHERDQRTERRITHGRTDTISSA